jgi:transposase
MDKHHKTRRRHSVEFKSQVVEACNAPDASTAAVALTFGLNANLVRQWRKGRGYRPPGGLQAPAPSQDRNVTPAFVPVTLPSSATQPTAAPADIRIELQHGALAVKVTWPTSAAGECAAWLRGLLR